MTPALPVPAARVPTEPVVVRIGYYALLVWTFLYFSRLLDVSFGNLKIMMVLNLVWLGAAFLSGGISSLLTTRAGIAFTGFFCWVVIALPFSVWKGGSMETVKLTLRALLLMGSIMALVRTTHNCRRLMYTMGFALAVAAIISRAVGEMSVTGRLALTAGTFADPNFYCLALLIGLPFLLLRATIKEGLVPKLIAIAAIGPLLLAAVATGSRSGMLALLAMFIVYFFRSSGQMRVYLIVGSTAAALLVSAVASDYILARFTTVFSSTYDESLSAKENKALSGAAVSSAEGRKHLLLRSIELTIKNPIVGVGPGMFAVAEAADAKEQQMEEAWHETHNSYTQVSSETGIPGLLFYLSGLFITFNALRRLSNTNSSMPGWNAIRQSALYLQLSLITLAVGATFLSIAYAGLIFFIAGLTTALQLSAQRELAAYRPPAQADAAAPGRSHVPAAQMHSGPRRPNRVTNAAGQSSPAPARSSVLRGAEARWRDPRQLSN
jgi:O-antigen ligase